LLNKYLKCSVWRLALRYDIYIYIYIYIYVSLGFERLKETDLDGVERGSIWLRIGTRGGLL